MIPKPDIQRWRRHAPWSTPANVEQDLVISRALVELFSRPEIAGNLAFRGGTALHKLHLAPAVRYSEDIDLVQVSSAPIGPVLDAVRACLEPWLGSAKYKQTANMCTLRYRFDSEETPPTPMRLKIEIMTREAFNVRGVIDWLYTVESPWFTGSTTLRTFVLEELLGTKLRALYQRRKGRDVFDLAHALQRQPGLDRQVVVDCFSAYMQRAGAVPSRVEFEANLAAKRAQDAFMHDMTLLIHPGHGAYDSARALDLVLEELVARLP